MGATKKYIAEIREVEAIKQREKEQREYINRLLNK